MSLDTLTGGHALMIVTWRVYAAPDLPSFLAKEAEEYGSAPQSFGHFSSAVEAEAWLKDTGFRRVRYSDGGEYEEGEDGKWYWHYEAAGEDDCLVFADGSRYSSLGVHIIYHPDVPTKGVDDL